MTDDQLLEALGRLAREERDRNLEGVDARREALVTGRLSEEARAELVREAATSDRATAALSAFEPLGERAREQIVDRALSELTVSSTASGTDDRGHHNGSGSRAEPMRGVHREPHRSSALSRSWIRWGFTASAGGLVAAAAALVVVGRSPALPGEGEPAGLPTYAIAVSRGDQRQRGTNPTDERGRVPTFDAASRLSVVITPTTRVPRPVTVTAFVLAAGSLRPLSVSAEVSPAGAARIEGRASELLPREGLQEIVMVVAPEGSEIVDRSEVSSWLRSASSVPAGIRMVRAQVRREDR